MTDTLHKRDMRKRVCRGAICQKEIVMARNKDTGNLVPLDPSPPTYRIVGLEEDGTPVVQLVHDTMVTHFVMCPDANAFSRGSRR